MKKVFLSTIAAVVVAGCASLGPVSGLETGRMVRYDCEGHDFSARLADDFTSARLRTHEGSVNLDRVEGDEFKAGDWVLKTQPAMQLRHKDKVVSSNCKKEA